jgi:DNA-binding CsgD family transcriptional regulator
MKAAFSDNKKLQLIFEQVWLNPEGALLELDKLTAAGSKKGLTSLTADTHLLHLIINVLLQRFEGLDLQQKELLAFYSQSKNHEKAALVTVWCMYGWIVIGRLEEADKLRLLFPETYKVENSPLAYACYYVFNCPYSEKNGYYEDFVRLAQEAQSVLNKYEFETSWHHSLLCTARLYHSRTQSNYYKPAEAVEAMLQVEKEIEANRLCDLLNEQLLYSYVMHYENIRERENSLKVLVKLVELTGKRKYNAIAKYGAITNLVNTYSLRNRQLSATDPEYAANLQQQLKWIEHADKLVSKSFTTSNTAFFYYTKAGFLLQQGQLQPALRAVAKSILIFYRFGHVRFLAQAYLTAHKIYKTLAIAGADYRMAYRTARCAEQTRLMTDKYYKQVLNRRIQSLELQFKIREQELNETLLKQQIDAMSKEVQLTTLNLHEKIQVLDEIKIYVNSLKKKELETRQLINTIAKKIDSVKITEEDKAMLQQKISGSNQHLNAVLAEKYPTLSNLEIRMCSLFQTGMTNKELAKLYGQGEKSYEQHRYRIKKKMSLGNDDKLVAHLLKLNTGK